MFSRLVVVAIRSTFAPAAGAVVVTFGVTFSPGAVPVHPARRARMKRIAMVPADRMATFIFIAVR
ncbi:MAG: hypothetical protein BWX50_01305 [Euryarchaeota archaeon ADurb.Bin009]|nr:MAG: hypothetical protein BWX50_01305 [Euryarchaeota archaeon ADurb.Bin009]